MSWWEGMTDTPPAHLIDWQGNGLDTRVGQEGRASERPFHGAGRAMSVYRRQIGKIRPGVAIDAFIFGGPPFGHRCRSSRKRGNWNEGVYMAATMGSETTAAAAGQQGVVRRDRSHAAVLRLQHERTISATG